MKPAGGARVAACFGVVAEVVVLIPQLPKTFGMANRTQRSYQPEVAMTCVSSKLSNQKGG